MPIISNESLQGLNSVPVSVHVLPVILSKSLNFLVPHL